MKNERMLKKALKYLPNPNETEVEVARTVVISVDEEEKVKIDDIGDYKKIALQKNDEIILDFGNHQVGYLKLNLGFEGSHPDAPVWMKFHFAENPIELFEDVSKYQGWISSSWIEEEQIHVDVVPSVVELPRRYAFRYVKIQILDISSKFNLKVNDAVCTAVSSADDNDLSPYTSKNPLEEKIDQISCRTLHNCMQRVFEDGPKRDRRLWIGDLRIQALTNYYTYKNNDMVKGCLYLFAALPCENGQVGACVFLDPEPEVDDTGMFDYSLFFVNILKDYYAHTKDMEALKDLWMTALTQIYIAEEKINDRGIVDDSDVLGWCFIDWNLELNKQASAQGVYMYALKAAIELAEILGETKESEMLSKKYERAKIAALRELWDEKEECFISGDKRQISVASQVWMILGGAKEEEEARKLLERIESRTDKVNMVTPYMYHNYIDVLIQLGEKEKAMEMMKSYWGGMVEQGADTFWELYNPENPSESPYGGTIVNSYCHAWSCGPSYFLRKYE